GRGELDVVIVTTAAGAHLEPAAAAATAGKHVVVEKPLEITLDRCDRIIDACAKNKVKLCTIFPSRFGDANLELKRAVNAGRFGRLTLGETTCKWWRTQEYYDKGGWRGTKALDGGGSLMNQAIHNVYLLLCLMCPETPDDEGIRRRFAQKVGGSGGSSDPSAISHVGHARQLSDFVQAISAGRNPSVDGREGRRAVEVILGVYQSSETGRVIEVKGD